jgi:hypothetical protein
MSVSAVLPLRHVTHQKLWILTFDVDEPSTFRRLESTEIAQTTQVQSLLHYVSQSGNKSCLYHKDKEYMNSSTLPYWLPAADTGIRGQTMAGWLLARESRIFTR